MSIISSKLGGSGIRTHECLSALYALRAYSLNHSDIPPLVSLAPCCPGCGSWACSFHCACPPLIRRSCSSRQRPTRTSLRLFHSLRAVQDVVPGHARLSFVLAKRSSLALQLKFWSFLVPVGCLLVFIACVQKRQFGKRLAKKLESDRKTFLCKSAWDTYAGDTCQIA